MDSLNQGKKGEKMKICKLKIDNKGRIQFPKTFLDANNIPFGSIGFMEVIATNHNAVRFTFIEPTKKETDGFGKCLKV